MWESLIAKLTSAETWIGAGITAVVLLILGLIHLLIIKRRDHDNANAGLSHAQVEMIEAQSKEIVRLSQAYKETSEQVSALISDFNTQLSRQRLFYEKRITAISRQCKEETDRLQGEIDNMRANCAAPGGCWRQS